MRPLPPKNNVRDNQVIPAASSLFRRLKDRLRGNVVVVGVGQVLKGDDGLGPALVGRLQGKVNALCLDAGTAPENFIGKIAAAKPDVVLIVDAAHLGLPPGKARLLGREELVRGGLSTHTLSPAVFMEALEGRARADVLLLGVQPQNAALGEEMSGPVLETLGVLAKELEGILRE